MPRADGAIDSAGQGSVFIVQGVPGLSVDVEIDGKDVADLDAGDVAGPLTLSAGDTTVLINDADSSAAFSSTLTVDEGVSSDVVLHLPVDDSSDPITTVFTNEVEAVPEGKASISVAHTAAIEPADIMIDGEVLFANIANGEFLTVVAPAGSYDVQIVPTGMTKPVILGPEELELDSGTACRMYAIGGPAAELVSFAPHVLDLPAEGTRRPDRVDTGTGGPMAALSALPTPVTSP